ncbi:hypothetical protein EIP86_001296 [Pleurotus ostreatoroseus]|nr:hypothetical protein EIP86_001296 [Pleurotus ostreatoroseus]
MSHLPVEMTERILGHLDSRTDLSTQSACALTCRTFLQETRRSRFRKVAVNGDKARKLLRLTTAQDVLRCVRKLSLGTKVWLEAGDPISSWVPFLLEAFPPDSSVKKVRLSGFADVTDAFIATLAAKFKSIESLHYDCCDLLLHPSDLALLILPFQELRVFKFTARLYRLVPGPPPTPIIPVSLILPSTLGLTTLPRPHHLSRLDICAGPGRFYGDNRASALFDAIVTHKLHEHVRDFRFNSRLTLNQQPAELATFAPSLGPQLTSLTLGAYDYLSRCANADAGEELVYIVAPVRNLLMLQFVQFSIGRQSRVGGRQILHEFTSLRTFKLRDSLLYGSYIGPLLPDLLRMLPASITSVTLEHLFSNTFDAAPNADLDNASKALVKTLLGHFPALELVHIVIRGRNDTTALAIEKLLTPHFQELLAAERPKGAPNLKVTFSRRNQRTIYGEFF